MERNFILLEEILNKYLVVAQEMTNIFSRDEIKDVYWFYHGQLVVLPPMIKLVEERNIDEFWKFVSTTRAKSANFSEDLPSGSKNRYIYAGIQTILNMIDTIDEIV